MIGAWAMAHHGRPRYTGDLDVLVSPTTDNAIRLLKALKAFGAPTANLAARDFETMGTTITLGVPPRRIDILNWLSGLTWEDANADAEPGSMGVVNVRFLSLRALRQNKAAAGRERDEEDLRAIE